MQLSENSQPVWVEFTPPKDGASTEQEDSAIQLIKSGVISQDRQ